MKLSGDFMYIDSHCHVLKSEYEDPELIINNAFKSKIDKLIINGYDLDSSIEAVKLAKKYENVYAAIGIGPENIEIYSEDNYKVLKGLLSEKKVVAIGEIGLDYYWTKENKEKQLDVFRKMLDLARTNELPVIVHSRESIEDTYNLLKEYRVKGIMHCYSGSYEMAIKFINLGFLIGVGGIVTFKNAKKIKDIVMRIDLKNISLETDSPYLSPEPHRGKINTPANLCFIAEKIANLKDADIKDVADVTSDNIYKMFTKMVKNHKN